MDRPVPAPGASRAGGALAPTTAGAQPDGGRDRGRDPGGAAPTPDLGRKEAAGAAAQAPSALEPARPLHGLRHPEPAWHGPDPPPAPTDRPSGQTDEPDSRAQ